MAASKRDSVYTQQVVDCFLALALQGVTEAEASRDYALLALKLAVDYAGVGRVNSEMQQFIDADVIMLMAPWLTLDQSIGDEVIQRACLSLEDVQKQGDQGLTALKARLQSIKSVCRGDAYAIYTKRMSKLKSGESRKEVLEDVVDDV